MADGRRPQIVVFQETPPTHLNESLGDKYRQICEEDTVQDGGLLSGVVMVTAVFKNNLGESKCISGTGFVIDDHHILTAGHIIWCNQLGLARNIQIHRDCRSLSREYYVDAGAVHFNWANDFWGANDQALLHVSTPFPQKIKRMEYSQTPTLGDDFTVKTYGFPCDLPKGRTGLWPAHVSHTEGHARYTLGDLFLLHRGHTNLGNSGGPVVDGSSGEAIAVHVGTDLLHPQGSVDSVGFATAINRNGNNIEKCISSITISTKLGPAEIPEVGKSSAFKYYGWSVACFT
ncbi:hypothetical protein ABKA04_007085 [Annulohypoxylon sp. FPYF3050]